MTQLFTYLLTHKLLSSCIRRYLVSRACDWVMPALSAVLITFSFQFSLTLPKVWVSPFLVRSVHTRERLYSDSNVKNGNYNPVKGPLGRKFSPFVIIAELWRPEVARPWKFCEQFLRFVGKRSLSNCLPASPHIWLAMFKILSKSVDVRRSYCRTREDHFCPVE